MEKKGFYFLKSYFEAAQALPNKEDQADFYNAVCQYAMTGEQPKLSGVALAMFLLAKPNIDASLKKAEAGSKGGSRTQANRKQSSSKTEAGNNQYESNAEANEKVLKAIKDKGVMSNDKGVMKDDKGVKEKVKKESDSDLFASEFEEFWTEYPRKVAKDKARESFIKARRSGVSLSTMLDSLFAQKRSPQWTRDGGQFIPHPTTWLNQHRWNDVMFVDTDAGGMFEDVVAEAF